MQICCYWFAILPSESLNTGRNRFDSFLVDLILLAITMYQSLVFRQSEEDELVFGNRKTSLSDHAGLNHVRLMSPRRSSSETRSNLISLERRKRGFLDLLLTDFLLQ